MTITAKLNNFTELAKQIDVEDYELTDNSILVHWGFVGDEENKEQKISRKDFEQFITDAHKLEYCDDMAGLNGQHVQEAGTITIEQYWDNTSFTDNLQDLKEYLLLNIKTA